MGGNYKTGYFERDLFNKMLLPNKVLYDPAKEGSN
jgi:hypothetical protein